MGHILIFLIGIFGTIGGFIAFAILLKMLRK